MPVHGVPVLATDRLILREHRLEDFPVLLEMWRDPAVTRYIGGGPRPEEEAWTKFLRNSALWAHIGYGYWAVVERVSDAVIGEIGFADFKRDISPSNKGEPELGYAFCASAHGKGYASEAGRAIIAWGDAHFSNDDRMSCIVSTKNTPSLRVAEKCGFEETARTQYHGDEVVILHRDVFNRA